MNSSDLGCHYNSSPNSKYSILHYSPAGLVRLWIDISQSLSNSSVLPSLLAHQGLLELAFQLHATETFLWVHRWSAVKCTEAKHDPSLAKRAPKPAAAPSTDAAGPSKPAQKAAPNSAAGQIAGIMAGTAINPHLPDLKHLHNVEKRFLLSPDVSEFCSVGMTSLN